MMINVFRPKWRRKKAHKNIIIRANWYVTITSWWHHYRNTSSYHSSLHYFAWWYFFPHILFYRNYGEVCVVINILRFTHWLSNPFSSFHLLFCLLFLIEMKTNSHAFHLYVVQLLFMANKSSVIICLNVENFQISWWKYWSNKFWILYFN